MRILISGLPLVALSFLSSQILAQDNGILLSPQPTPVISSLGSSGDTASAASSLNRELATAAGYYFYLKLFDASIKDLSIAASTKVVKDTFSLTDAAAGDYIEYAKSALQDYEQTIKTSNTEICRGFKSDLTTVGEQEALINIVVAYEKLDSVAANIFQSFSDALQSRFGPKVSNYVQASANAQAANVVSYTTGLVNFSSNETSDALGQLYSACDSLISIADKNN